MYLDNLPLNPSSFFIFKQVKQDALHSIVREINCEKSMASRYEDSRFNMDNVKGTKVFWT